MTPSQRHWTGTGLSHPGLVRSSNQDAFAIDNDLGLWIVADGMGGYSGGEVASEVAVATIMQTVRTTSTKLSTSTDQLSYATAVMTKGLTTAKVALQDRITEAPELKNMGTTIVAAWLLPDQTLTLAIAHIGDSRAYLIRDGQLTGLTKDHSLVQQLLVEGRITPEQVQHHPKRNVIVRALGANFPATPDVAVHRLKPDDRFLLCTDGLTKMLSNEEIHTSILEYLNAPEDACRKLIERANEAGGNDNTTALLITPQGSNHFMLSLRATLFRFLTRWTATETSHLVKP